MAICVIRIYIDNLMTAAGSNNRQRWRRHHITDVSHHLKYNYFQWRPTYSSHQTMGVQVTFSDVHAGITKLWYQMSCRTPKLIYCEDSFKILEYTLIYWNMHLPSQFPIYRNISIMFSSTPYSSFSILKNDRTLSKHNYLIIF